MTQLYRKISLLTDLELMRMRAELKFQKWQQSAIELYAHRQMAFIRITDTVRKFEVPAEGDTFRWSEAVRMMPFTVAVMRRLGYLLGGKLDDFGTAYFSKMVAGDYVPDHTDADAQSPYYANSQRIQVTLEQSLDAKFILDGQEIQTEPGDCITFDNTKVHSVTVGGGERIVLLFDVNKRQFLNGLSMETPK